MKSKIFLLTIISLFISNSLFSNKDCEAWFYSIENSENYFEFSFIDGSSPATSIEQYFWEFGDGSSSNEKNPDHIYDTEGNYFVKLTISTSSCQDTYTQIITVGNILDCFADFFYLPLQQNTTVEFHNLSVVPNNQTALWSWDFGDGTESSSYSPTHTYSTDTSRLVTLSVIFGDCTAEYSSMIYMGDDYWGDDCEAMFSFSPIDPAMLTFEFWNYSWQGRDSIQNFEWNFGDGATSNEENPIHTYQESGQYKVSLLITTNNCTSTSNEIVYAGDSAWYPSDCQSLFWFSENQNNGLDIQFVDISSTAYPIISWSWGFGDNTTSFMQNPNHIYSADGQYDVTLTVLTEYCESNFTTQITIEEATVFCDEFNAMFVPEIIDDTIYFHDLTIGNPTQWFWDFGDDDYSELQNPVHVFDELGVHEVAFASGNGNCANSLIMEIDISNNIIVMAYALPYDFSSIEKIKNIEFDIFPNPAKEFININKPKDINGTIFIYNSSGQLMFETVFDKTEETKQIDISTFQTGIYIIKFSSDFDFGVTKFVK